MQDLHTAAWPVPYSGTFRPDSLGEDRGLGEPANRTVKIAEFRWECGRATYFFRQSNELIF